VYPEFEYGLTANIVLLDSLPTIVKPQVSEGNPLHPTYYHVAFSPEDKAVLSVSKSAGDDEHGPNLYTYLLTESMTDFTAIETVPGLQRVNWNEATKSFLLVIRKEDTIEIVENGSSRVLELPLATYRAAFETEVPDALLWQRVPDSRYAISSLGQQLAISPGDGRVFIFECE
jgi:hypothetical protein